MTATRHEPHRARRRVAVAVVVSVVVLLAAMWFYAFFIADTAPGDRLHDGAWAAQAEATCRPFRAQIDALAPARSFATIEPRTAALAQRAAVVDQATDVLAQMVADLRRSQPANDDDRLLVVAWLADYDSYLSSRRSQTAAWRRGEDPRFSVAQVGGQPIDSRMDQLADDNAMRSCMTPGDLA